MKIKKIFLLVLLIAFTTTVGYAQFTKKGAFLVGGTSSLGTTFNTYKYKLSGQSTVTSGKSTSITLSPQAGYFITNNIAVGAQISIGNSTYKEDGSGQKSITNSIVMSPFGRYYFDKFYGEASFSLGTSKSNYYNSTSKDKISGWGLAGGYLLPINEFITFEPQIGYASTVSKDMSDTKRYNSGLFIRVGVFVYISKK